MACEKFVDLIPFLESNEDPEDLKVNLEDEYLEIPPASTKRVLAGWGQFSVVYLKFFVFYLIGHSHTKISDFKNLAILNDLHTTSRKSIYYCFSMLIECQYNMITTHSHRLSLHTFLTSQAETNIRKLTTLICLAFVHYHIYILLSFYVACNYFMKQNSNVCASVGNSCRICLLPSIFHAMVILGLIQILTMLRMDWTGLLLRQIKDFWRVALLISTLLHPKASHTCDTLNSHTELDRRREIFGKFESAITQLGN